MEFENEHLERLTSSFTGFPAEGFYIFALGADHLHHLICAYPKADFAGAGGGA